MSHHLYAQTHESLFVPVGYAEVAVVGERFLIGSLPSDWSFGAATHLTPESDTLAFITAHVTQRDENLRGNFSKNKQKHSMWFLF